MHGLPTMSATKIPVLSSFMQTLKTASAAFFKHDVALKRADDGVRLVLQQRPGQPRPPTREELAARREGQELALMQAQLAELLNELPETRHTLRHLVFVEQALAKKGLRALHKLPLDVLERALEQLEGLVTNWSPVGLASLRSKMAVAIIDREHQDPEAEADAYRTAAVLDHTPAPAPAEVEQRTDDEALAAAYAALGNLAPTSGVEMQGELGSRAARQVERAALRPATRAVPAPDSISFRELQS
jgi:hypothetical protein